MKIGILSRHPELYSTRRLVEAAQERGHSVRVVDYLRCYMNIAAHRPLIMLAGKALELDGVVPRIGASHTFYGTAVVRQLEMMGAVSANSSQGIARSRDQLRCLQLLSRAGVDLPVTGFASSAKDVDSLLEIVGGAPLVVKLLRGTQYGVGTILAETRAAAESVIEAFGGLKANILVQEYIHEEEGADIRAFVVSNKVVAAMRWKTEEDPGPNLQRVGKARRIKLSPEERKMAVRAAKIAGLSVAGVDLLRTHRGPLVMEVNSSPDIEGIERATSVDVAGKIIELLEKQQAAASGAKA